MNAPPLIYCIAIALASGQFSATAAPPPPVDPAESILSEDTSAATPNPKPPPYTLLRFNEDYRYLV
jgi:hypothetical protein